MVTVPRATSLTEFNLAVEQNCGCDVLLGLVRLCRDVVRDASNRPVWFEKMRNMIPVNISTIQCAVGRINVGHRWGILDLTYGCASTTFIDDEEDGNNHCKQGVDNPPA